MKIKYIALCLLLALVGCQREEDITIAKLTFHSERTEAFYYDVEVSCVLDCNAPYKRGFVQYATSSDFADYQAINADVNKNGKCTAKLTDLDPDKTYYIRFEVSNNVSSVYTKEYLEVRTMALSAPVVTTQFDSIVTYNSAEVGGKIRLDGGLSITERGVVYSTSKNPTIDAEKVVHTESMDSFVCHLKDLEVVTKYYVRAYAINGKGVGYGEEIEITTLSTTATLGEIAITDVGVTSVKLHGIVLDDGGAPLSARGFCYNTKGNPTISDSIVNDNRNTDSLCCEIVNLHSATTYYICAFATNENGTVYSEPITFTTLATVPTITTGSVKVISYTYAVIGGDVVDDGGAEVTERGVVYATSQNPTTSSTKVVAGSGTGSFTCDLTDLQDGTTYYVRAYAINEKGTAYGKEVSFTTIEKLPPTVGTAIASNVTYTSATVGGDITDDGGTAITERGVVYATSQNPTTSSTKVVAGSGTGSFTCNLTNLQDGTTYYVRAYAMNEKGTAYGEEVSFTTIEKLPPTVSTAVASNVTYTSATVGGNVTKDGGAAVTERGVVYATSQEPTTSSTKVVAGSGTGSFACNLTDLQDGTTYYVRAYAINEKGTAYGKEVSFTTKTYGTPLISTTAATNIFNTSAVVGGNITEDGGASITERGVVYGTSQTPTTNSDKIECGSGTGSFSCTLNNLESGVTYYVRAYAIYAKGTIYGEEISFTTMTTLNFPITTTEATDITCTSAVVGGNITSDNGSAITERGVCYGTSPSPTMSDMTIQKGRGVGIFTCTLTDLQDGVTYYVRAYGVNTLGISYGDEISFTTIKKSLPTITIVDPTKYSITDATIEAEVVDDGCLDVITRGVCYSTSPTPSITDNIVANGKGVGTFSCQLSNLQEATTYYVRAYAENEKGVVYSDEKSFTTKSRTYHNGYEYVDLGLSVMWATMNVGASSPEVYGDYFAWGEVEPKTIYSWSTYEYCGGTENTISKYCTNSNYGIIDHKKFLEPIDDAAQANWGGDWRMPTDDELTELHTECTWTWTTQNGVNGYKVTSKSNGNSIFFPVSSYWSSSLAYYSSTASGLMFYSTNNLFLISFDRYEGISVRPVWREMELPTVTTGSGNTIIDVNVISTGGAPVTECGIVYSTLPSPTISDTKLPIGSGVGIFLCSLTDLQEGLKYYVRAYATNQKGTAYGEEISFIMPKKQDGYAYIDLGLPSGLKWATMNVGANSIEDSGVSFSWGEVETKSDWSWSTYKWCEGSNTTLTKYCTQSDYGKVDNKTILDKADDAACVHWGGSWRMPSSSELVELCENCTWVKCGDGIFSGYLGKSKINGHCIFLPSGGIWSRNMGFRSDYGNCCSILNTASSPQANVSSARNELRFIRPVCP